MGSRVRHIKKFANGRMTPEEYHSKYAFPPGSRCAGCGAPPVIRAIVMMELAEARKNPNVDAMMLISPADFMNQIVQIKGSDGKAQPYFRCSIAYACKRCGPAMEKQLAKAPSHCIVEINRGPDPTNRVLA